MKRGELDGTDLRAPRVNTSEGTKRATIATSVLHKTADLLSLTRENPRDVSAWLSYAARQPHAFTSSGVVPSKSKQLLASIALAPKALVHIVPFSTGC